MDWIKADKQLATTIRFFEENCLGVEKDSLIQEQKVRAGGGAAGIFSDDELPRLERNVADLQSIVESLRAAQKVLRATPGHSQQRSMTDFLRQD